MSQYIESGSWRAYVCNDDAALVLNIIHAKLSLLSNVVASGLNDFRPLSEVWGREERFSAVECCGTDEYLYPGLVRKSFFHALFLQIFSYGKRFCHRLNL
ncbi:hypothetical protein ACLK2D_10310 [Escherichia coli]